MKHALYLLFAICLSSFFVSCNQKSDGNDKDQMAEFADDEKFKEAHDTPKEVDNSKFIGSKVTIETAGESASAYAISPAGPSDNFLFVIHEWWGLNDNIKEESDRLFKALGETVHVMALDLYDGKSTANREEAGKFMQSVKPERCAEIIQGAIDKTGSDANIGTIGWCFGGGWSLQASIMAGDKGAGCVLYYGMPEKDARKIAPLKADVLGIFASEDGWITPKVEQEFKNLMAATGKNLESHSFKAGHAFANPSGDNFNSEATQQANDLALAFLKERLN
ncbi:MAG: dienelactone hydrolase family protein [Bacteroidota bacterium]